MDTYHIVKARTALGAILSGYNIPDKLMPILQQAHDGLLAEERKDIIGQAKAFQKLGYIQTRG